MPILRAMGRQLSHRGPDDERIYDDGRLALVYRRLAIVDVAGGGQPIWNESRTALAAVNGEIYNSRSLRQSLQEDHRFSSRSDCEPIIHLYEEQGISCVARLNGMFAMVLWDAAAQTLHLVRDRLGIKPLYYTAIESGVLFASELKALLMHPECPRSLRWRDIDLSYLDTEKYMAVNYTRTPTFIQGVHMLAGGERLMIGAKVPLQTRRYWRLDKAIACSKRSPQHSTQWYVSRCATLVEDSVRRRLMSDVPIGVFLSGGLDSSIIAALANQGARHTPCFSVYERTTVASGDMERARQLTQQLDCQWYPVVYDHRRFADQMRFDLAKLESFIWMMDAPRFTPEAFFKHELHRYVKTVAPDIKVILLGQGVDEFCGGYSQTYGVPQQDWASYEEGRLLAAHRERVTRQWGIDADLAPLLRMEALDASQPSIFHAEMRQRIWSLQSHALWNEDRVSSSQGVEARVPFLDHRLVEFFASIPSARHAELFQDKFIMRQAAKRWLDDTFYEAPKVAFWEAGDTASVHRLMRRCLLRVYPQFRAKYGEQNPLFSIPALDRLFQSAQRESDHFRSSKRLLSCICIAIFARICARNMNRSFVRPVAPPSPLDVFKAG